MFIGIRIPTAQQSTVLHLVFTFAGNAPKAIKTNFIRAVEFPPFVSEVWAVLTGPCCWSGRNNIFDAWEAGDT